MTTNVTLSSPLRNALLLLAQKNLQHASSLNIPVKADVTVAVDKFTASSGALARANSEKTTEDTSQQGSGKLKLANLNGEGANLVALKTRQQLGSTHSLNLAKQSQQALLRLL
jgi:hypothetical protein